MLDLDNEREGRIREQQKVQESEKLREIQERRPFMVLLIDADADGYVVSRALPQPVATIVLYHPGANNTIRFSFMIDSSHEVSRVVKMRRMRCKPKSKGMREKS